MNNRFDRGDQGFYGREYDRNSTGRSITDGEWSDRDERSFRGPEGLPGRNRQYRGDWATQRDYGNYGNGPWGGQEESRFGGSDWRDHQGSMGRRYANQGMSQDRSGRDERWGMGTMSDESDRFRQPSENQYGRGYGMSRGEYGSEGFDTRYPQSSWGQSGWGQSSSGDQGWGGQSYGGQSGWVGARSGMGMGSGMGMRQRGQYFGKGPKGYKRSDERIKEDVNEHLSLGHLDASDVEVQVKDGEVTLTGSVVSREMKRMAESLIEDLSGVVEVNNQLRVKREDKSLGDRASGNGDTARRATGTTTQPHQRS